MARKGAEGFRVQPLQSFEVEMIPCPPGTKPKGRLPRGPEDEPSPYRIWWLLSGVAGAALVAGIVIGKFLLS